MGDRLGIQVAVDILSSFSFLYLGICGICILVTLIQINMTNNPKILRGRGLTWSGFEQSNLGKSSGGVESTRLPSLYAQYTYLPILALSYQDFSPTKVSTAISP